MRLLVTCGPSYEPLDQVRRLTNLSTGALGVGLAEHLAAGGHEVICLKGVGATHPDPAAPVELDRFTTNDVLASRLRHWARTGCFTAVFHVAALCDYKVASIEALDGPLSGPGKIPSALGELRVRLAPARTLIGDLRGWFPKAWIVGWKYEVEGSTERAIQLGVDQMARCRTDACVVNGPACDGVFFLCDSSGRTEACPGPAQLIARFVERIPGTP